MGPSRDTGGEIYFWRQHTKIIRFAKKDVVGVVNKTSWLDLYLYSASYLLPSSFTLLEIRVVKKITIDPSKNMAMVPITTIERQGSSTIPSLDQEHTIVQYDSPFTSNRIPSSTSPAVSIRQPGTQSRSSSIRQGPAHTAWVASSLSSPHSSVRTPPTGHGRRATISAEYMTPIINVLNDPLSCGFFLAFCRMQHAVENILFIMECDRFKDLMSGDKRCWTERYSELDKRIFNGPKSAEFRKDMDEEMKQKVERPEWPSKVLVCFFE